MYAMNATAANNNATSRTGGRLILAEPNTGSRALVLERGTERRLYAA
jgi:hypothetical protein